MSEKFIWNKKVVIVENACENIVGKMVAIYLASGWIIPW